MMYVVSCVTANPICQYFPFALFASTASQPPYVPASCNTRSLSHILQMSGSNINRKFTFKAHFASAEYRFGIFLCVYVCICTLRRSLFVLSLNQMTTLGFPFGSAAPQNNIRPKSTGLPPASAMCTEREVGRRWWWSMWELYAAMKWATLTYK